MYNKHLLGARCCTPCFCVCSSVIPVICSWGTPKPPFEERSASAHSRILMAFILGPSLREWACPELHRDSGLDLSQPRACQTLF